MSDEKPKRKPLKQWVGIVTGFLLPVLAIAVFFLWNQEQFGNWQEFKRFLGFADILPKILSLAVVPNLAAFFIYMRFDQLNASRGVLLATILIGFAMVLIRFA